MTATEDTRLAPGGRGWRDTRHMTTGKIRAGVRSRLEWIRDRAQYLDDELRDEILDLARRQDGGAAT